MITGGTQLLAVIGDPVGHSISPRMHTEAMGKLGLDYVYLAFKATPDTLENVVNSLKTLGVRGYSVTMPCKTIVGQYLDELSPAAELMGAVNTVVCEDGRLIGHNTDGQGFMRNLKEHGVDVIGKKITLIGAGGAGSAIYTQAALDGVKEIALYNVKDNFFETTNRRVLDVAEHTGCSIHLSDLDDKTALAEDIAGSALLVDATRVGMPPLEGQMNVDADMLRPDLAVADTVYNPPVTELLATAARLGATTVNGLGMLLWQAAIAEKIWVDQEMPVDFIEELLFSDTAH